MSYPTIIPTLGPGYAFGDSPVGQFGFEYTGFQYVFLFEGGLSGVFTGDLKIHAMRSADAGVTWTEQDAANAIPGTANITFGVGQDAQYTVVRDGTTVWLMQTQTTSGTIDGIQVASFSLLTNTWTASALHVLPAIDFYANGGAITLKLILRGANNMILYYSGPRETITATKYARCYYATWSSGAFGTGTPLPGQAGNANNYQADSAVCDSAGITHFFYLDVTAKLQYHVGMDAAGAFGTPATVHAALYSSLGVFSEPIIYGSPEILALAGDVLDSGEKILFFSASAALNPAWSQATITSTDVLTSNSAGFLVPRAIAIQCFNTTLAAVWTTATGSGDKIGFYYYSTSPASAIAWAASAKLWDAPVVTTDWASSQVNAYAASTGIAMIGVNGVSSFRVPAMESSEATQYYLLTLGPPPPTPAGDIVTLYAWVADILDPTMPPFNLPLQFSSDPSSPPERRITGVIDGTNATFTMTTGSLITEIMLFRNGDMLTADSDYTFAGNVITFIAGIPVSGDILTAAVFNE